ncbi:fimbrial assembly protein [Trinickia terrae]|uniref:Fimbrial assembly protein n=1 Tax=Trinickia terrae TaxID=2571161 RepID=A0A4U1IBC5_9BURK|nr:fimbrial assembly protein [Trinickia terrae]TKC90787.1 fimbrial assembly protein [Trinickia terrae]
MMAPTHGNLGRPVASGLRAQCGGFNLLPYRQRDARRARRRFLIECLAAALMGCAAVSVWAGWEALVRARLDAKREALEATLASLAAPLAEYRRLEGLRADQHMRAVLAQRLSEPRERLVALFDALSREADPDVELRELKQTDHEVSLLASAKDSASSSAWLARLKAVRGVRAVDVSDLRHVLALPGDDVIGAGNTIEFTAHVRWDGAAPKLAGDARGRTDNKRGER